VLARLNCALVLALALSLPAIAADYPAPVEGELTLRNFRFLSGEVLPELRLFYRTIGTPRRGPDGEIANAVLIVHGTTGSGASLLRPEFAGELFRAGGVLDATRYYIVLPDALGHGRSSKPSDGLRARFPRYGYPDMVEAQRRLLVEGLGVRHLRLVMGTSMGGMHTWLWGGLHPEFMDALLPLASLPVQIAGRNRGWRRTLIDAITHDPGWKGGDYASQPAGLRTAGALLLLMSSTSVLVQQQAPTLAAADTAFDRYIEGFVARSDANDVLYQVQASFDYDPAPLLGRIKAPLVAINFADDLINPPELGLLERGIAAVPNGRAITIPAGPNTVGHGTHTIAVVWQDHLRALLEATEPKR
jgi:homoserine O-acetyltransferase